jgi:hypothetical protein
VLVDQGFIDYRSSRCGADYYLGIFFLLAGDIGGSNFGLTWHFDPGFLLGFHSVTVGLWLPRAPGWTSD